MDKPTYDKLCELKPIKEWLVDHGNQVEIYLIEGVYWKCSYAFDPEWGTYGESVVQVKPVEVITTEYQEV